MKRENILIGKIRYFIWFLVSTLGIVCSLVAIFYLSNSYDQSWKSIFQEIPSETIYIKHLTEEQSIDTVDYFLSRSDLGIWVSHTDQDQSGNRKHFVDVMGNEDLFSAIYFGGDKIVSTNTLHELLNSKHATKVIGQGDQKEQIIADLPTPLFSTPIVIDRLDTRVKTTRQLSGEIHISGLTSLEEKDTFLREVSKRTGISQDRLVEKTFGSWTDHGMLLLALMSLVCLNALALLIAYLVVVLRAFEKIGSFVMLGWSKGEIWRACFMDSFIVLIAAIPVISGLMWILSSWSKVSINALWQIMLMTSFAILLLGLILVIPSVIIFAVSALNALHRRLPIKFLLGIAAGFYSILSLMIVGTGFALDRPIDHFFQTVQVSSAWKKVQDMYVLSSIEEGSDQGSINTHTTNSLEKSLYRLYQTIGDLDGVSLIHDDYFDREFLKEQARRYPQLPQDPFHYLTYSYQALEEEGFPLQVEDLELIKSGVRLYYLPDHYSTEQLGELEKFLREEVKVASEDVETPFTQDQRFVFRTYTPQKELFTWSTNVKNGILDRDPIIFVASPDNLYFLETANLQVTGYNGYLKIKDHSTLKKVEDTIDQQFEDLQDNHIEFTTVRESIASLQKNLSYTFYLFGGYLMALLISLLSVLWSLILMYQQLFRERLQVTYFLGTPIWRRYAGIGIAVLGFSTVEGLISMMVQSRLGVFLSLLLAIIQLSALGIYVMREDSRHILKNLKE